MNFKNLNESFNRIFENMLNEGGGAGYSFNGTAYITDVSDVKIIKQEKTEKYGDLEVYFTANMGGAADFEFESYDYRGELEDVRVAATKGYVLIESEELEGITDLEGYILDRVNKEEYTIDFIYGAGWVHVEYDGTLSTEKDSAESRYGDAQLLDLHLIYQDDIDYVDHMVSGDYDSEYTESCNIKKSKKNIKENSSLKEAAYKRIAKYGEFDNGHVIHNDWEQLTSEEAEDLAREISIKYPDNVYYVAYDDIMNPSSDLYWKNGKSYNSNKISASDLYKEDIDSEYNESCSIKKSSLKEEVTEENAFDELQDMKDIYGADAVLEELARAMGNYELATALNYLKRVAFDEYDDVDESLLTEKNWNVTIISGSKLRNAIESENITEIIPSLIDCYKELASKVNDVDRYAEEDIAELEFILQDYNSGEIDDEEAEDAVDYKLSGFYDLCDNVGAFVALNEKLEEARSNYGGKKGPFWYFTKHGIGPGMLPKDVDIVDIYEDDNMGTWVALDSILTTDELKQYEMKEQNPPIK